MLSYCLKCKKKYIYIYIESINPKVSGTSNGKTMTLSRCSICGPKNQCLY